jgi:hypothetical protein
LADAFSLPYNLMDFDPRNWAVFPLVVFGHDGKQVHIADRSSKPFTVSAEQFSKARARVKQDKFRVVTLDPPDMSKLPSAAQKGLWQCIRLYTEAPPRGKKTNFGLAGLQHFAKMLTNTRNPHSWARYFAPGRRMWCGLVGQGPQPGLFGWLQGWGDGGAERGRYANFLEEAAVLLKKPKLNVAADLFRKSHAAWKNFGELSLPESSRPFKEARELLTEREKVFIEQGQGGLKETEKINKQLKKLLEAVTANFPLTDDEAVALRRRMSEAVLEIHDIEYRAVEAMQMAVA